MRKRSAVTTIKYRDLEVDEVRSYQIENEMKSENKWRRRVLVF